jgi:hypothetical protein
MAAALCGINRQEISDKLLDFGQREETTSGTG